MSQLRIDQVNGTRAAEQTLIRDYKTRIHLYAHSQIERERPTFAGIGKQDLSAVGDSANGDQEKGQAQREEAPERVTLKMRDGTELEMPRMGDEDRAAIETILAQATPEQASYLVESGSKLAAASYEEVREGRAEGPYSLKATTSAQTAYEAYVATSKEKEKAQQVHGTMLAGLYGAEQNLHNFFQDIKHEQRLAADIRTDVAELEDMLSDWPDGAIEDFSYREVHFNDDGSISIVTHDVELSRAEAEALLTRLGGTVDSLGQFENQAMFELQLMVNRYQQAMNTMSNIIKSMDDTHKAIIQNAKA